MFIVKLGILILIFLFVSSFLFAYQDFFVLNSQKENFFIEFDSDKKSKTHRKNRVYQAEVKSDVFFKEKKKKLERFDFFTFFLLPMLIALFFFSREKKRLI